MSEKRVCPNCGNNEALGCGRGYFTPANENGPEEYDCSFWWGDTLMNDDAPLCEDCPLIWCRDCKDTLVVNAVAFRSQPEFIGGSQ